jgi:imidazolonepropionase
LRHELSGAAKPQPRTLIRNALQLVTLQGASGARCGSAMNEIGVVTNGSLLISSGVIEQAGPTRRVENLAAARQAREIDAKGRIVLPAFIDPDAALIASWIPGKDDGAALRVTSKRNLEARAAASAAERVRYGCLTIGAQTPQTAELRGVIRLLRTHRALQANAISNPLRIRSVVAWDGRAGNEFAAKWLPAIRRDKLASVIDLLAAGSADVTLMADTIMAVSAAGFGFRLRSQRPPGFSELTMALNGGAIAIVAPLETSCAVASHAEASRSLTRALSSVGCVRVVPISDGFEESEAPSDIRGAIDAGAAIALSFGRTPGSRCVNMQFLVHLAVGRFRLTPEEALTAVTYNAACSLRLSHATGSLEPGKSADLLVIDAPDYRELGRRAGNNDVSLAMRAGRVVMQRGALIPD